MDVVEVRTALRRAEEKHKLASTLKLLSGFAATILTPVGLGFIYIAFGDRNGSAPYQEWMILSVVLLVLMGIAYIIEWRTRGGFVMQRLREIENSDGGWYEAITRDRAWRYDARGEVLWWDLLLYAPRLVFEARSDLRQIWLVRNADREQASLVVQKLIETGRGVAVGALQRRGESEIAFATVIAYLMVYGIVGVGEKSSHVWLLTEAKESMGLPANL
ncbi:MAG: hypothetical protein ACTHN5_00910 [Phycisphaerae bacterium]